MSVRTLEHQLTTRPPLGARPAKVDIRTPEGKKWKRVLLAEMISFREQGFTFTEIGAVLKIHPSTLTMWAIVAGRADLTLDSGASRRTTGRCQSCGAEFPPAKQHQSRKYCDADCRANSLSMRMIDEQRMSRERAEAEARRTRISQLRRDYRRCRSRGEPLPWRLLRAEPRLTVEQRNTIERLVEEQRRDGDVIGRRPWLVSGDVPTVGDENAALWDTLVLPVERASSEIEQMMIENGSEGARPRPVKKHPWRVRCPKRETADARR